VDDVDDDADVYCELGFCVGSRALEAKDLEDDGSCADAVWDVGEMAEVSARLDEQCCAPCAGLAYTLVQSDGVCYGVCGSDGAGADGARAFLASCS
jgi:hypothetical protein